MKKGSVRRLLFLLIAGLLGVGRVAAQGPSESGWRPLLGADPQSGRMVVSGQTGLSDGAELSVVVEFEGHTVRASTVYALSDRFEVPLRGEVLLPGRYRIGLGFYPDDQDPRLRDALGAITESHREVEIFVGDEAAREKAISEERGFHEVALARATRAFDDLIGELLQYGEFRPARDRRPNEPPCTYVVTPATKEEHSFDAALYLSFYWKWKEGVGQLAAELDRYRLERVGLFDPDANEKIRRIVTGLGAAGRGFSCDLLRAHGAAPPRELLPSEPDNLVRPEHRVVQLRRDLARARVRVAGGDVARAERRLVAESILAYQGLLEDLSSFLALKTQPAAEWRADWERRLDLARMHDQDSVVVFQTFQDGARELQGFADALLGASRSGGEAELAAIREALRALEERCVGQEEGDK
ncbi:MAG: hypothetical protein HY720_16895 [Planctomycetes bacterium]|nr:hypothetical protein [Planctomycetota bacterium]